MARLSILKVPDPRLGKKAKPVDSVDDSIRTLMDDMLETMYAAPGIGLAAPQVGVLLRVIVLDVAVKDEDPAPLRMANPKIVWSSEETCLGEEGCLSVPDQFAEVARPAEVRVRYLDYKNVEQELTATGLLAICIQHEIDHLDGVLFIDYLSRIKRGIMVRKVVKAVKADAEEEAKAAARSARIGNRNDIEAP